MRVAVVSLVVLLVLASQAAFAGAPAEANAAGQPLHTFDDPLVTGLGTRVIRLANAGAENGTLVATFEQWSNAEPRPSVPYPVKRSTDGGATWTTVAELEDGATGEGRPWPLKWTPTLLELADGTIVMVGAVSGPLVEFQLWRSADHGRTWTYGGVIQASSQEGKPVWEPCLILGPNGELIVFFADERDPAHAQKISRIVSTDGGATWSAPADVVAHPDPAMRPGMPIATRLPDGRYLVSYELVGAPVAAEARVVASADGISWPNPADLGTRPESADRRYLASYPYLTWAPGLGDNGQLFLLGGYTIDARTGAPSPENRQTVLVSYDLGATWERTHTPFQPAECQPPGGTWNGTLWGASLLPSPDGSRLRLSSPGGRAGSVYCGVFTGEANVATLPYAADFAAAGEAGWATYSAGGCWAVSGAEFTETCAGLGGGDKALVGSTGWRDYTVGVDVVVTEAGADAGVLLRGTDPAVGFDALHGYYAAIDSGDGTLVIGRLNHDWAELTRVPLPGGVGVGQSYRLTVTASGATITAAVGDTTATATDTTFAAGMAGLRTFDGTASFRAFQVDAGTVPIMR